MSYAYKRGTHLAACLLSFCARRTHADATCSCACHFRSSFQFHNVSVDLEAVHFGIFVGLFMCVPLPVHLPVPQCVSRLRGSALRDVSWASSCAYHCRSIFQFLNVSVDLQVVHFGMYPGLPHVRTIAVPSFSSSMCLLTYR